MNAKFRAAWLEISFGEPNNEYKKTKTRKKDEI